MVTNGEVGQDDLGHDLERIGGLLGRIEAIADPASRAATRDLVQALMAWHGAAFERALEVAARAGEPGAAILSQWAEDPVISGVLLLYGLHPDDIEVRVRRALDRMRPQLRKQGCEVRELEVSDGVVRITVETGSHGACGSTTKALRDTLEGAIYDAAPDLTSLVIAGLEEQPASGFVALDRLTAGRGEPSGVGWTAPQGTD
jgi:hypothetical protein